MAVSDVTFGQDGGDSTKLHPYVVALVRWCVSCVWSAATVLLHRLMATPLPPIAASKFIQTSKPPRRPASSGHLHPEPLVDCVVLHEPNHHQVDFIFVHGLYGSLENTWRQGDWRYKYKIQPNTIPLKRTSSESKCSCEQCNRSKNPKNIDHLDLTTENFYNYDQVEIVDNFELQAQFVRELFENENNKGIEKHICDMGNKNDFFEEEYIDENGNVNIDDSNGFQCEYVLNDAKFTDFKKDFIDNNSNGKLNGSDGKFSCEYVLNDAKFTNFKEDFCDDDFIDKNGNSNGKLNGSDGKFLCECVSNDIKCNVGCGCVCDKCYSACWPKDWLSEDFSNARIISVNYTSDPYLWRPLWIRENKRLRLHERAEQMTQQLLSLGVGDKPIVWVGHSKGGLFIKQIYCEAYEAYIKANPDKNASVNADKIDKTNYSEVDIDKNNAIEVAFNVDDESETDNIEAKCNIWRKSVGFMFYSVPHRGSSLADIKTPITARSIELMEISKDNALVLSLQERWLQATEYHKPIVRSLVETNRTLMSVLWLRIVSVESADAGIGALCGISLDHREICKPSSRNCVLYKELLHLIHEAINRWRNSL